MTRSFDPLAARAKASWSQDTHAVYEAASQVLKAEMDEHPEQTAEREPDQ